MPSIMYESTNNFCQLLNKPGVIIAVAIWIHLVVMAYNSESIDEFLTLLLSPFSKKRVHTILGCDFFNCPNVVGYWLDQPLVPMTTILIQCPVGALICYGHPIPLQ